MSNISYLKSLLHSQKYSLALKNKLQETSTSYYYRYERTALKSFCKHKYKTIIGNAGDSILKLLQVVLIEWIMHVFKLLYYKLFHKSPRKTK